MTTAVSFNSLKVTPIPSLRDYEGNRRRETRSRNRDLIREKAAPYVGAVLDGSMSEEEVEQKLKHSPNTLEAFSALLEDARLIRERQEKSLANDARRKILLGLQTEKGALSKFAEGGKWIAYDHLKDRMAEEIPDFPYEGTAAFALDLRTSDAARQEEIASQLKELARMEPMAHHVLSTATNQTISITDSLRLLNQHELRRAYNVVQALT